MPDIIPCPECGAPAQITDRFWLDSTDGPLEHLKTGCVNNLYNHHRAHTALGGHPPISRVNNAPGSYS